MGLMQGKRVEWQGGEEGGVAGDGVGGRRDCVGARQAVVNCGEALRHELANVGGRGDVRVGGRVVVGEVSGPDAFSTTEVGYVAGAEIAPVS